MFFPSLLGNERLKRMFADMPPDKVGSAIIFAGADGTGKVTAATDLAAALLCTGADRPCGSCPSCRRMKAGTNSDFELFGEGLEKAPTIDQVREMRSRSFVRSGDAGFKVFVIANADRLNPQSQNALLKVLEEPLNTVFILTCANVMDLLQTVRSRCTVYNIEPLDQDTIVRELSRLEGYTRQQCTEAAAMAQGSLEKARDILANGQSAHEKAALQFCSALGNELAVFKAANAAGALSREDYMLFCIALCRHLSDKMKTDSNTAMLIELYDYIQNQMNTMTQNPSVSALSGALAAFCGDLYGGNICPKS
ncbi:MAG: hypothetical protein IKT81_04190 [Clostridia bacterium]|nr:hypothetical protein [Clostridia bacterium]